MGARERTGTHENASRGGRMVRRDLGLDLLAGGRGVGEVASALGVSESTVFRWRDTPEGQARLAAANDERERERAAAAEARRNTVVEARTRLHELALKAVEALEGGLNNDDPQARLRAAREVLDRAGVPRTERVETGAPELDLSKLTPDERATMRALLTKMAAPPESPALPAAPTDVP